MKTKAALAADPDDEWLESVAAAARERSTLLQRRCGACHHLIFAHSEQVESQRPVGSCLYAGCDCVTGADCSSGW